MNDDNKNISVGVETTTPPVIHKNLVAKALSHLNPTQLTLVIAIIIFLWQWVDAKQQITQVQHILAQRLAEFDGSNKANLTLNLQSQELVRELGGKLSLLENKYAESQSQRSALETLYQDLARSRDQMVLAEVEQLLLVAGQQLQLSNNVKAALIAMQQADSRLQHLDRPALSSLRSSINNDIARIRALPDIDISAVNSRLDNLISIVNHLPLLQDIHSEQDKIVATTNAKDNSWKSLLKEFWEEIKSLVRIENTHQEEMPLIPPSQIFFLRENLKLRLLSARLSLLSHDETSFKNDIKATQDWIKLYYDSRSTEGTQAISILQKLSTSNIKIEFPNISGSLEAVRHYRASLEKVAR